MKVMGEERGREMVEGKASSIALAAASPYYQCKPFMQI